MIVEAQPLGYGYLGVAQLSHRDIWIRMVESNASRAEEEGVCMKDRAEGHMHCQASRGASNGSSPQLPSPAA